MRLIDADALIGKFNAKYKANGSISKGTFAKIVNEVPTIESPRDWTPCAEGLPESGLKDENGHNIVYLVTTSMYHGLDYMSLAIRVGGKWYLDTGYDFDRNETILAWMPKPALYRADTAGKVKED